MNAAPFGDKINVPAAQLQSWPLPAEIVISGRPDASGCVLSKSDDVRVVRGIWDCTPGKFRWDWSYDETIVVVSGRATVEIGTKTVELNPGDLAFFERGQQSVWTIHEPFRKGFHADSPEPMPF